MECRIVRAMMVGLGVVAICITLTGCEELGLSSKSDNGDDVTINAESGSTVIVNGDGTVQENQDSDSSFDKDVKKAEEFRDGAVNGLIDL